MIRTRIAPSPTGFPHIGTIYQVLFDFAYARKHQGKFILRIEDTDRARFVEGAEEVIYQSLEWFNLIPDESPIHEGEFGPYRQSERLEIYNKYINELIDKGHAYYCFCTKERLEEMRKSQEAKKQTPMYDKTCRNLSKETVEKLLAEGTSSVVRMKIPENRKIVVRDLIIGEIEFESSSVDDQVIQKADGFPTYHLGVVVDDHLMEITHVFRGKEWISSTPKHVILYEYFGWEMPEHAHLPLILNGDGKGKLSKRHGHASVDYYRQGGFLPEAVLNYLSNVVWNHPEGKEIYSFNEFISLFDISQITSQGARFDMDKLLWMNQQYIQNLSDQELKEHLISFSQEIANKYKELLDKLIPLVKTRLETLKDFEALASHFVSFTPPPLRDDKEKEVAKDLLTTLESLSSWEKDSIMAVFREVLQQHSIRMPLLYYILTGEEKGLPLPESVEILGKEETLSRLKQFYDR